MPVRYGTRLVRIEPANDHLRLHLEQGGATRVDLRPKGDGEVTVYGVTLETFANWFDFRQ